MEKGRGRSFRQEAGERPGRLRQTHGVHTAEKWGLRSVRRRNTDWRSPAYPFALHASVSLRFTEVNECREVTRLLVGRSELVRDTSAGLTPRNWVDRALPWLGFPWPWGGVWPGEQSYCLGLSDL